MTLFSTGHLCKMCGLAPGLCTHSLGGPCTWVAYVKCVALHLTYVRITRGAYIHIAQVAYIPGGPTYT